MFADGEHTVYVTAVDKAGNRSEASRSFYMSSSHNVTPN